MIKDLQELTSILDTKVKPLVDAIKAEDPTTEKYGKLLENFNITMVVTSNISQTLINIAQRAQEIKKESEKETNGNDN